MWKTTAGSLALINNLKYYWMFTPKTFCFTEKKEEKKVESESEEDDDMGFGLFD